MSEIETETLVETELEVQVLEESQVIVHCKCDAEAYRVWPTTYLIDGKGRKSKLITAFNISFAPMWTLNNGKGFTLVFEGLSKDCVVFDLIEEIPQPGGFEVRRIARNNTDVYQVTLD